jgi:hypothetical protein
MVQKVECLLCKGGLLRLDPSTIKKRKECPIFAEVGFMGLAEKAMKTNAMCP